ncbi:hypothetical protein ACWEOE_20950 [Amycolatopsis sp. NPDC004368]
MIRHDGSRIRHSGSSGDATGRMPYDPPAEYGVLRAADPTSQVRCPAGMEAWLVTRYADVRAVLADHSMSSRGAASVHVTLRVDLDEPVRPGSITQLDGEPHSRVRKVVLAQFTVRRVELLRTCVQELVESHLDAMLARPGEADLVRDFALPIPSLVICQLLGVPYADRERFQRQSVGADQHRHHARAGAAGLRRAGWVPGRVVRPEAAEPAGRPVQPSGSLAVPPRVIRSASRSW